MKKVLIADDHGLFRGGLAVLLRDSIGVDEVIETATLDETLAAISDPSIDTVILDLSMPGMQGISSVADIKRERSNVRLIVMSASDKRQDVLGALSNGAQGYIWKGEPDDEIANALATLAKGAIYAPAFLATSSTASETEPESEAETPSLDLDCFTPRQRDVMLLLGEGKANKEIARDLDLAESTVKIHLAAVYRILGARNRTQAVVLAQKISEKTG